MRSPAAALRDYVDWYGPLRWPLYVASRFAGWPETVSVHHRRLAHPVLMRPRSTDVPMYHSIFTQPQYDMPVSGPIETIVDCGGNVGYAAVWFAMRYPKARIFSIEPAKDSYALLVRNTAPYPKVVPIHAAVWDADTSLDVVDIGQGACSFETRPRGTAAAEGVIGQTLALSIPTLMRILGLGEIDILKLDVEGAEQRILHGDLSWLAHVGMIAVEFHDERCPGLRELFAATASQFFDFEARRGENVFYAKRRHVDASTAKNVWTEIG